MAHEHRAGVSRRKFLAASLAGAAIRQAPTQEGLTLQGWAHQARTAIDNDPVLGLTAQWTDRRQTLEDLIFEWQRLERLVMTRAKRLGLDMGEAVGSRFPEAATMEVVNCSIHQAHDDLDDLARRAQRLQATSAEGALAKISLGLRVQGPYNWESNARELMEGGLVNLRAICSRGST